MPHCPFKLQQALAPPGDALPDWGQRSQSPRGTSARADQIASQCLEGTDDLKYAVEFQGIKEDDRRCRTKHIAW